MMKITEMKLTKMKMKIIKLWSLTNNCFVETKILKLFLRFVFFMLDSFACWVTFLFFLSFT